MSIKQTMRTPIAQDPNMVKAIVNEANDGLKATPAELVIKAMDDSTFTQVNESNPLPVKMSGDVELNVDPSNPLPVTGAVQLTGSNVEYVGYSHEDKNTIAPDAKRGDSFIELDTKDVYFYDGTQWVVF